LRSDACSGHKSESAKSFKLRSPDERSDILDHSNTFPDLASLIRATGCTLCSQW
jgi:hypothetical protein